MKRIVVFLFALALLCACFAGCSGSSSADGSGGNSEKFKIGVVSPTVTEGWGSGVTYYAEQYCKELAINGEIEYRLFRCNSAEDVISGVEQLRTWGVQAVVVYPQWEGVEKTLQSLIDDGIPVISVDIDTGCKGSYRITGDDEGLGRRSAQYIVQTIGRSGTVVMLNAPSGGAVSTLRQKGFEEKIAEIAPKVTVYTYAADFTRESGQAVFADALANHEQIDAVFSMDDETSIGVLRALKESGRTDVQVITGGGGRQEYLRLMAEEENDELHLQTVLYSPIMAQDAIDSALALLRGETVQQNKTISATVLYKGICEKYLDENSPY